MTQSIPPIIDHFAALAPDYDAVLCDVWGVIHNSIVPFAAACDALIRIRKAGGAVILITNAPRPGEVVIKYLDGLGVPREVYDDIISSGDVTRHVIASRPGQTAFHLGPERDAPIFKGLDVERVPADRADYVVCTGLFDDETETAENYRSMFAGFRERNLFMLCANPDVVVARGDSLLPCAGALADLYAQMGGDVLFAGKPHRPIYDEAFALVEKTLGREPPHGRILAIGDSVRTDLAGAAALGLQCLFVAGGIHAAEIASGDASGLSSLFAEAGVVPHAVMRELAW